jgi:hypothetical protein
MYCDNCGERMCGDGFTVVWHCPNAPWEAWADHEPDATAIHCPLIHVSVWKSRRATGPEVG